MFGTGIAFTIPPFVMISLKILSLTSLELNILVTSVSSIGFLKSGLSVPYFSRESLYFIRGKGVLFIFFPYPNSLNNS